MNYKKIIGIILIVVGVAMIFVSNYIIDQVNEGKLKISKAEKQVQQGKSLFSLTPITKAIGDKAASSAERKIDAGKAQVSEYEELAGTLHMGGIILIVAGVGVFALGFLSQKKKKR